MSLKYKAVIGALWTVATSVGGRIVGLVGTFVLTRFLAPESYGEVSVAAVFVMTVGNFLAFGFGQYLVANPNEGPEVVFHATFIQVVAVTLVMAALVGLAPWVGPLFDAPSLSIYVAGLALAVWLDYLAYIPGRVLARDMRFRVLGAKLLVGEVVYACVSVGLAAFTELGAKSMMYGIIARSAVNCTICVSAISLRDWAWPARLRREVVARMWRFGMPMYGANMLHWWARRGDNLVVAGVLGTTVAGQYNLAYNLADIPATQVGEHIGDVLMPSFAKMESSERRQAALCRAVGLLCLVVFPLAVGLGAIGQNLVTVLFDARWQAIGPMLVVLSVLSVVRPVGWLIGAYLLGTNRSRPVFFLELVKTLFLLGFVYALAHVDILWACAGVGLAFFVHAAGSVVVVHRRDGVPISAMLRPMVRPLLSTAPMAAAVVAAGEALQASGTPPLAVVLLQLLVGGGVYVAGALVIARPQARDLLGLLQGAIARRRGVPSAG
ncbi:MAG: oligosaccharide flippase family protein [Myxococcota bacterium]